MLCSYSAQVNNVHYELSHHHHKQNAGVLCENVNLYEIICNADSQPSSPPNSLSALHTTETCSVLSVITVHELARRVRGVVSVGSLVLLFRNAPKKGRSTNKMAFIEGSQPSTDGSVPLTIYAKQLNL